MTILEDYLNAFSGIVITVSHDRYFLDNVADRIFEFSGDGTLTQYEGGYTDYLEAKQRMENSGAGTGGAGAAAAGSGAGGKSGKGKTVRAVRMETAVRKKKTAAVPGNRIARSS